MALIQRELSPIHPSGWFLIGRKNEFPLGCVITKPFMDGEIVVFHPEEGTICVSPPFCPHLGAHLGKGGEISHGKLKCPFHGLCFDKNGLSKTTSMNGDEIRLRIFQTQEWEGFLFIYYNEDGSFQKQSIPSIKNSGFSNWIISDAPTQASLQDVTENSVDLLHFNSVHGIKKAELVDFSDDGIIFKVRYKINKKELYLGGFFADDVLVELTSCGIGLEIITFSIHQLEFFQSIVFQTWRSKKDKTKQLIIKIGSRISHESRKIFKGLFKMLPLKFFLHTAHRVHLRQGMRDITIFNDRSYLQNPQITKSETTILKYREWVKQFYKNDS